MARLSELKSSSDQEIGATAYRRAVQSFAARLKSSSVVLKALERPNQITIVTVNHIELVDPAIGQIDEKQRATRPGRIDRIVYVGPMSEPCRRRMVERILPDHPHLHDQMVRDSEGDTAAQIQDRCAALALRLFWKP